MGTCLDTGGNRKAKRIDSRNEKIRDADKKKEISSEATQFLPSAVKIVEKQRKGLPAFIFVIGGPGSNKENLRVQAVRNMPGFVHVSVGNLLRTMASSSAIVKDAIVSGEMVAQDIVLQLVEAQIMQNRDTDGIVIDGFPRDVLQLTEFENKSNDSCAATIWAV